MDVPVKTLHKIPINALVITIVIHIVFLFCFSFKPSTLKTSIKPDFTFLGAILDANFNLPRNDSKAALNQQLPIIPTASRPNKKGELEPNKPLSHFSTPIKSKESVKSTFLEKTGTPSEKHEQGDDDLKKLGIEPNVNLYEPMRINK